MRHHGGGGGTGIPVNRNHVFDSSGPDVRVRGTAQQLFEKYLQFGRDSSGGGDRVQAESYYQHAEHYFRVLNAMNQAAQQNQAQNQGQYQPRPRYQSGDENQQPELAEAEAIHTNAAGETVPAPAGPTIITLSDSPPQD
jgi:hypothetical protein